MHIQFSAKHTGLFRRIDCTAPENEQETEINIDRQDARKFLKSVVHELNAPFWDEDLSDAAPSDDPYIDILPEYRGCYITDLDEDFDDYDGYIEVEEPKPPVEDREPLWALCLELNDGENKEITFYNQMHEEPQASGC